MNRWLTLTSRIGTVLVAIGLALLLISLIPSGRSGTNTNGFTIESKTFQPSFFTVLTPQQSETLTVSSSIAVDVYLLEVTYSAPYDWISQHTTNKGLNNNVTYLQWYLGNVSQIIAYSQKATLSFNYQYIPTKITNVTLVISNPTSSQAFVQSSQSISNQVAPASKVATLADWSIPVGLVLAVPWFRDLYQRRVRSSKTGTTVPP